MILISSLCESVIAPCSLNHRIIIYIRVRRKLRDHLVLLPSEYRNSPSSIARGWMLLQYLLP